MPSAPAQVMVYTRAPAEASSPHIACVEQLDPASTRDTPHPGSEGFKWPTAGQDLAPSAGKERPGGRPWFKTKAEMPGPVSHWPTPVRETLSPCLAHSFYSVQKRRKPHRSHFQNLAFGVHTLKNEFCPVGIAQHGKKPLVGPKSPLDLGWLQSKGQRQDRTALGPRPGLCPGVWGEHYLLETVNPRSSRGWGHTRAAEMGIWSFVKWQPPTKWPCGHLLGCSGLSLLPRARGEAATDAPH